VRADPDEEQAAPGLGRFSIRAPFGVIRVFDAALARVADILAALGDEDTAEQRRVKALLVLARPDLAARLFADYTTWTDRPHDPPDMPPPTPSGHSGEMVSLRDGSSLASSGQATGSTRGGGKPVIEWDRLLPQVVVTVHVYAGVDAEGIARVEGCGAMSLAWVREHLTKAAKVTVRPVLDIEGQAPVDAYEIPHRHRQAVRLMTPADTFPFSTSLNPDQIDHTDAFVHGAAAVGARQSRIGNYGPLSTLHHRIKTHGRWAVKQPFPGIYLWRDPHGQHYLVDHTGTRTLRGAA
jgi:hypothetical protein